MRRRLLLVLVAVAMAAVACSTNQNSVPEPKSKATPSIVVTSGAFADGRPIPAKYTCAGEGISPPLSWRGQPKGTVSFALVVDDPDAVNGTFVHWLVFNLPLQVRHLDTGEQPASTVRGEAHVGSNSAGETSYAPPCPPKGSGVHHYRFTVYALPDQPALEQGMSTDKALETITGDAIAQGRLVGTVSAPSTR